MDGLRDNQQIKEAQQHIKFYLILVVSVRVRDTHIECFNFLKLMKLKQEFLAFSPTSKLQKSEFALLYVIKLV